MSESLYLGLQLPRLRPGMAPHNLYRRVTTVQECLLEGPLVNPDGASVAAGTDFDLAKAWQKRHPETVWVHIYDGDTGECVVTLTLEAS